MVNVKLSDLDKLSQFQDTALLLMRIVIAGYLAINQGWPTFQNFMNGVTEYPDPLHLGARTTMALMVFTEVGCASFVLVGLFTRLLAIPVAFGFTVAVFIHHWSDPFGWKELPSLYWVSFIAFAILGPGKYSLDYLIFRRK
jgi:putative oxidoreductase